MEVRGIIKEIPGVAMGNTFIIDNTAKDDGFFAFCKRNCQEKLLALRNTKNYYFSQKILLGIAD